MTEKTKRQLTFLALVYYELGDAKRSDKARALLRTGDISQKKGQDSTHN